MVERTSDEALERPGARIEGAEAWRCNRNGCRIAPDVLHGLLDRCLPWIVIHSRGIAPTKLIRRPAASARAALTLR